MKPANLAAVCTMDNLQVNTTKYCLVLLSLTDGSTMQSFCNASIVLNNVAYDDKTQALYASAYDVTKKANFVYVVGASGLTEVIQIPGTPASIQGTIVVW